MPGPKTRVDGRKRGRPDADDRVGGFRVRGRRAVAGQLLDRHLDGQRLDIETGQIVDAATGVAGQLADGEQIADTAEIDPEGIVALTGEDGDAVADLGDGV